MKSTDKFYISMSITFALLLGGIILTYNKSVNNSVESSEIKEAKIIQSLYTEDICERNIYEHLHIIKKSHQISKDVSVNKHIVIDSNNNGIKDDKDIVFDVDFFISLPWNNSVSYFDTLPYEFKDKKELKNINRMPKYIVGDDKLYVYLPKEGNTMIYLNSKHNSAVPLAVKNQNGKYSILNLPSNIYGKKGKILDENLYNIIERKQNQR